MIPKVYKEYFYQLVKHLNDDHNIKVVQKPGVDDAWYPMLNLIYIDQNLKYRERLFSLLHESGHALIDNQIRQKDILCFNKNTPHKIKSKKGFVHTLNEEILAWNYGKELAKKMEFKLESNKLEDYMSDCIMSYIRLGLKSIYGSEINADIIWTTYV